MKHRHLRPVAALVVAATLVPSLAACGSSVTRDEFPKESAAAMTNLHELTAPSLDGGDVALSAYRGKVTLFVNVASECGLTPQYAGLQALHDEFAARGFSVLGFPSNEFGGQEPGTAAQIRSFCTSKYSVTFPMFAKVEVKPGDGQSPVYRALTTATGQVPGWNFAKYLVGRDGRPVAFFSSMVKPDDPKLRAAIESALAAE